MYESASKRLQYTIPPCLSRWESFLLGFFTIKSCKSSCFCQLGNVVCLVLNQLFLHEGLQYTYFCNFSVERPRSITYQFPFAVRNLLRNFCEFWERATFIHFGRNCHVRICSFFRLVGNSASILYNLHGTILFNHKLIFSRVSTIFDLFFCEESCFLRRILKVMFLRVFWRLLRIFSLLLSHLVPQVISVCKNHINKTQICQLKILSGRDEVFR